MLPSVRPQQVVRYLQPVEGLVDSPIAYFSSQDEPFKDRTRSTSLRQARCCSNSYKCGAVSGSNSCSSFGTGSPLFSLKYSRGSPPSTEFFPTTLSAACSSDESCLKFSAASSSVRFRYPLKKISAHSIGTQDYCRSAPSPHVSRNNISLDVGNLLNNAPRSFP